MDIEDTLAPNSDQLVASDFIGGPRIITVTRVEVKRVEAETVRGVLKPAHNVADIFTVEFGDARPFKPNPTNRRLIAAAWSGKSALYVGRRIELYREDDVNVVGGFGAGIRISAMSHIDRALTVSLKVPGSVKPVPFTIQPLPDAPVDPEKVTAAINAIRAAADTTTLDAIEKHAQQLGITGHITDTLNTRRTELGETS